MPFPRAHLYLTWGGTAWLGGEIWQCGVRVDRPGLPDQATFESLEPTVIELHQSPGLISSSVQLEWIKLAPIGTDGRYPEDAEAMLLDLDPVVSGAFGGTAYAQVACKVTLRTARRRGRAHVGGFYLPAPGMTPNGQGFADSYATNASIVCATFLDDIAATLSAPIVIGSNLGAGRLEPVTGVVVGNVPDTQRRRRNALPETYSALAPLTP